jgi:hypothetical protein
VANIDIVQLLEPACPTCRRPLMPHGLRLSPTQRRILEIVQARGAVTPADLRDAVWSSDPSGGPENPKTLTAHVYVLNTKLRPHGIRVGAGKGAGSVYTIQKAR